MNGGAVYSGMWLHHIPPDLKHVTGENTLSCLPRNSKKNPQTGKPVWSHCTPLKGFRSSFLSADIDAFGKLAKLFFKKAFTMQITALIQNKYCNCYKYILSNDKHVRDVDKSLWTSENYTHMWLLDISIQNKEHQCAAVSASTPLWRLTTILVYPKKWWIGL